ncbi:tyrosine-type recombinase/integrase [Reinekea marinisedimentorum]|uniref:Site-specific recombinase XerD n=1 Tax=Reinekea marinisedimentorum TaxID=230495 RepID=A0A4R3I9F1_9GAMM|nr:site-specific integrase [Reinekea marinisedimentorum]TCS42508.1 site-specific recombinase XerD [Reinekea marinisedimentorum]
MATAPLLPVGPTLAWLAPIETLASFNRPTGAWSESDAAWVYRYLCNGCGSPATRKAVQGELLRLAYYMRKHNIPALAELNSDDAAGYRDWLAATKEPIEVSVRPVRRLVNGEFNAQWRPFRSTAPLAGNAIKTALRLISGCLAFLQDDPHCPVQGNPFRRVAKGVEQAKRKITDVDDDLHLYTKALSAQALDALFAYLASDQFRGSEQSRTAKQWLLMLFSQTAVRVETLVTLTTDNLFPDEAQPGKLRLRFRAKHNSRVDQPWSAELNQAFEAYCMAYGFDAKAQALLLWAGIKSLPQPAPVSASSVWAMLRTLGRQTEQWVAEGIGVPGTILNQWTPHDSRQLLALHPHTLRHTWCTHAVNIQQMDLLLAKQHMGHSSVTVTERYVWPVRSGAS